MKVETHNHPTAISPFPGAATGAGGEIRDEGATGLGAKPKAGSGRIFGLATCASRASCSPGSTASARRRASPRRCRSCSRGRSVPPPSTTNSGGPNICGYFRTLEQRAAGDAPRTCPRLPQADHAGRRPRQRAPRRTSRRARCRSGAQLIVLGGPAMLIGLGGGAASSVGSGAEPRSWISPRCSAATPRCSAARRRSSIAAGHSASDNPDRADPRRRRRRPVQCGARGGRAQPARRAHRAARDPERRAGHVAAGDLVQRGAGALRAGAARRQRSSVFARYRARERCPFAVIGEITDDGVLRGA